MKDLNEWWSTLSEADRDLFTAHADTSPLPAEVVDRFTASGQMIAGAKWRDQPGYGFDWPSRVQEYLREKAAAQTP